MPQVLVTPDTLDEANRQFDQAELSQPIFLNSLPKSGSHLLRNILRMFVPVAQQYQADFIQWPTLQRHRAAFDPAAPKLSWGHLFFADASVIETASTRRILLYRDPYDWVIAQARFFLSEQFSGNVEFLKSGALGVDELLTMMIFGIPGKQPSLHAMYELNVAAWFGSHVYPVKFEDLVAHAKAPETDAAASFFSALLNACGIAMPADWQMRVRTGANPAQSGTARDNLTGIIKQLPDTLGDRHRALVDFNAPGLRALLGYA
ncbi:hypothetical protein K9B35_02570 [Sphingomonas sp. R647]|uniref:hypothetical protein n=1 Tax=Sphingomonas sp. R647 TaxID=2875233 RepID=UPI001CD2ECFE|nr:hypothetical protein [Sphingomonas sp. R647]MCA1196840.1 hypothetical protein [Sphingomonas sp. R647]